MKCVAVLTLSRIALAPLFTVMFVAGGHLGRMAAVGVLLLCLVLELLDGHRLHSSRHGAGHLWIGFVDGVSRFAVFAAFWGAGYASLWMLVILFYRDVSLAWARIVTASHRRVFVTRSIGQLAAWCEGTASLGAAVSIAVSWQPVWQSQPFAFWLLVASTAVTAVCAFDYLLYSLRLGLAESKAKA